MVWEEELQLLKKMTEMAGVIGFERNTGKYFPGLGCSEMLLASEKQCRFFQMKETTPWDTLVLLLQAKASLRIRKGQSNCLSVLVNDWIHISKATENKKLIILVIDDYTNIHIGT